MGPEKDVGRLDACGCVNTGVITRPAWLPPLWLALYLGSIFAANISGSTTDKVAGMNIEHVLLGGALGLAVLFLLFEGNFRRIEGLNRVVKCLALFGLAILLGLLSSFHPGPEIAGADQLVYWCGLILSIGVAALAALRGHTRWVLAAVALAGIPLAASVLQPFVPFLAGIVPAARLQDWQRGRATGFFRNPNWTGFALYCAVAAGLCLYWFVSRRLVRWACLGLSVLYTVAIFFTVSRASILVTLLTVAAFLYALWRKAAHRWAIVLIVVFLAGVALHVVSLDRGWRALSFGRMFDKTAYKGDSFRVHALRGAARDAGRTLFLGEGTGQFTERSHIYLRGVSLPKIDIYDKAPHNQFLALWVEWGLLAVLLIYVAHAWVLIRGWRCRRWRVDDAYLMLLVTYVCVLLFLQLHGTNSPASCALLGLGAGTVFACGTAPIGRSLSTEQP